MESYSSLVTCDGSHIVILVLTSCHISDSYLVYTFIYTHLFTLYLSMIFLHIYFYLVLPVLVTFFSVTHRLDYLFTATTKNSGLPSVVAVAIIDGVQIEYYDGNTKEVILRQDWIENVLEPKAWTTHVEDAIEQHNKMERALKRTMMQFNHTKGEYRGTHAYPLISRDANLA